MAPAVPAPFQDLDCTGVPVLNYFSLRSGILAGKSSRKQVVVIKRNQRHSDPETLQDGAQRRQLDKDLEAVISVAEGAVKYVVFEFDIECANPIRFRRPLFPRPGPDCG